MDICHDSPVALTPLTVQRLMDVYRRHMALMTSVGLFVPKHHLMLHFTHRASFFGNPSWYATATNASSRSVLSRSLEACLTDPSTTD